jgi:hypothetical protein
VPNSSAIAGRAARAARVLQQQGVEQVPSHRRAEAEPARDVHADHAAPLAVADGLPLGQVETIDAPARGLKARTA